MRIPTAYLDNCISPSGVVKEQLPPREAAALDDLRRLREDGRPQTARSVKTNFSPGRGNDTRDVYKAAKNRLDYFVIRDDKTILKHRAEVKAEAGIEPVLPSEVAVKLASADPYRE